MQPVHPGDASLCARRRGCSPTTTSRSPPTPRRSTAACLTGADLLVIAHPSDPRWERTTGIGSPQLAAAEMDAIEAFVRGGGGLVVLGETEQDKYGNNLNELLARFGSASRSDTVQDYEHYDGAPTWVLGRAAATAGAAAAATCSPA